MHFSVSGHVTLGVVRWRHELIHICSLWVLSKFGPIEAHKRSFIANWFFPSNGIKNLNIPSIVYSCMDLYLLAAQCTHNEQFKICVLDVCSMVWRWYRIILKYSGILEVMTSQVYWTLLENEFKKLWPPLNRVILHYEQTKERILIN